MAFDIVETTLNSAVASGGTITFSYPANRLAGYYRGGDGHRLVARGLMSTFAWPSQFTIAFGANIVVTYNGSTTIPAGSVVRLELQAPGDRDNVDFVPGDARHTLLSTVYVPYGAVSALAAATVVNAQAVANTNPVTKTAAIVTLDVPRVLSAVSSSASDTAITVTITGADEYGRPMVERIALNGTTTVPGLKAFKTVSTVVASGAMAGNLSVGQTKVLGLPCFLSDAGMRIASLEDGAVATAGTYVAGSTAVQTLTTGDVRGTWSPNANPNGTIQFACILLVDNPNNRGRAQFAG
jgi:hypothetical protein